ncbi:23 kDa integral membrane protein-like [Hoplias malabaricus]|uniref:23 kDa integral membrane protein-like n=1 Tax=Hoplias malabaricus TaxID=27720 RepID=UPI0034617CF8
MAKGSTYMRGLCIALNVLLMIFGVILLLFAIVANSITTAPVEGWLKGVLPSVGFGLVTIVLSILGIYGAYKNEVLPLILYSVFMIIVLTALMVLTLLATFFQPQVVIQIEKMLNQIYLPTETDEEFLRELNKLQQEAQCCGLNNHRDWHNKTPSSCFCPLNYLNRETECVKDQKYIANLANRDRVSEPPFLDEYVYKTGCGPVMIENMKILLRILLGMLYSLATIKIAAVIVALLLWHKIHSLSSGSGFSKDGNRTKYELRPDQMS